MPSPLANPYGNMVSSETSPAKASKIPHRQSSNRATSAGPRSPQPPSTDASGSPIRPSTAPLPLPSANSMNASSRIPKAPRTPSFVPLPRSSKAKSGGRVGGSIRSSLPRARSALDTPTVKSPAAPTYKKPSPLADRNKPLPSPPIAQIIDPNSPPKAHRTLVDAESGSPSDDVWPVLRPQTATQVHDGPSPNLAVQAQQQQQSSLSENFIRTFDTDSPVKFQSSSPASVPNYSTKPTAFPICDENAPTHAAKYSSLSEPRRLSSNNPYAKDYHAVSPTSDVAVESPLARKKSRPAAIAIPPRLSSKRSSQPLFPRERTESLQRPVSQPLDDDKSTCAQWPLSNTQSDDTSPFELSGSPAPSTNLRIMAASLEMATSALEAQVEIASSEPPSPSSEHGVVMPSPQISHAQAGSAAASDPKISIFEALEPVALAGDNVVRNCSSLSIDTERLVSQAWMYDSDSKYWSKTLSWRDGEPYRGPTLRIYRDADAVVLGNGVAPPEECEDSGQCPGRSSMSSSLGALAGRKTKQTDDSTISDNLPSVLSQTRSVPAVHSTSPTTISPIRAMRPPRQISGEMSLRNLSSLDRPPTDPKRISSLRNLALVHESTDAKTLPDTAGSPPIPQTNPGENREQEETSPAATIPAKKANKVLGLSKDTSPGDDGRRLMPSWMAPTLSSLRAKTDSNASPPHQAGRVSNRDFRGSGSSASAGSPPPIPQRNASRVGLSKLRTSISARPASNRSSGANSVSRATQTPLGGAGPHLPVPPPNNATVTLPPAPAAEAKKTSTLHLKAKRSFRNLFPKNDTKVRSFSSTKARQPVPKSAEPKRASIATSGKTLAKRISNNFSKVHVPLKTTDAPNTELHSPDTFTKRQATLAALEDASPVSSPAAATESAATLHFETADIVNNLLSAIATMNAPSAESLRRLDMAEVVLHVAELVKQSQLNTEKARKYAREAELHAERIKIELGRLDVLMEFDFEDPEIKKIVKQLKGLRKIVDEAKCAG